MRFSAKATLAQHTKRDGTQVVYLKAIINRRPVPINLGFALRADQFDHDHGLAKQNAPNAQFINFEINKAITRAHKIFLDYQYSEKFLTPDLFRREFIDPSTTMDFVQFMEKEIEVRRPKLEAVTYGAHITILNKLKAFQKRILFAELTVDLIQRFENTLIKKGLKPNTIHRVFRTIKVYLHEAERKEIRFKNPFKNYHVKTTAPTKPTLLFDEVQRLFNYYNTTTNPSHKKLLRYFLFSCTTGVRISDISLLEWNNLHGSTLIFLPFKTRKGSKLISIPLSQIHIDLIGEKGESKYLFDCFAKAVTNRMLKDIAKLEEVDIKKHLTYHISRHTFATEFLDRGGKLETLQQLLGHSMITTTMVYSKVKEARKQKELSRAFEGLSQQKRPENPRKRPAQG